MNNIKCRPVTLDDNLSQIARLIFQSNTEMHRSWRPTEKHFVAFIEPWLCVEGFLYHYKNLCIATECNDRFPLAIISGLDSQPKPHFSYETYFDDKGSEFVVNEYIKDILVDDKGSEFVVNEYIKDILSVRSFIPKEETLITALCVDPAVRSNGIGQELLDYYMGRMQKRGTKTFRLDCATDNHSMVQLCEKYGFRRIAERINRFSPEDANIATYTI